MAGGANIERLFSGGTTEERRLFVDTEKTWERYVSLKWDFGQEPDYRNCTSSVPSHIRVSFVHTGHWSYVGTDAINKSLMDKPSLNIDVEAFGDLRLSDKKRVRGVMLHEIGHALGLEHEHQSPADTCIGKIQWNVVYADLGRPPNSWDRAKVDQNLRALTETERLRFTAYDRLSIMHYSFPASWFSDVRCAVGDNDDLSMLDKEEARRAYPQDPNEQSKYIATLKDKLNSALARFQVSDTDRVSLANDIQGLSGRLEPDLRRNVVFEVGRDNTGIILNNVDQSSSGPCSPNVAGVQGSVSITSNCK